MHGIRLRSTPRPARLALLLLPAVLSAACGGDSDPASERARRAEEGSGPIVIGAAWPWAARKDILYAQGLELAVEQANAAGGVLGRPLELRRRDDQESVDQGRLVAQEFGKDPDVVAVIGHLQSYVTVPAAAIYDLSGLVMVSPTSTTPELTTKGYGRVFRTIFTDDEVGRQMARYALARGYRHPVIYYARNEYGRGLANAFEEEAVAGGAQVVSRESYDPSLTANPRSAEQTVSAWQNREFDAVFIAGQDEQGALLVAELRRRGVQAPVLGSDALATPTFLKVGGAAVEGTVLPTAFHPESSAPEVRSFVEAFRRRYGRDPDVGAALGYDAVRVLAEGIRAAHSAAPDKVAAALHGLKGWKGVTGAFTFGQDGDLEGMPVHKVVVRDGQFRYLEEKADSAR
jgi:branched-chain amino acid transport system substrate-binding protein